ncbi:antibiotic biosynthesis monooxygenase [Alishewanella sp. WH16-1]|uniref:antibiotic biosynthesis monooxygenase n=1 Tax=Alishewanella sp. WH16-1 TaxID=1651088 RepID=UPI00070A57BA|nr:antibiotic biosynthesis monooxygenase [Alishewanella sp. WH16-1]KRS19975.1 antibiotic biosynthesis monooxygenase [Alishewanella sp. WH16-1]
MTTEHSSKAGVSVGIDHQVRIDQQQRYEQWLAHIIQVAAGFPGHQGVVVLKPAAGQQRYCISVRFSSQQDAERWLSSAERTTLIEQVKPCLAVPENVQILSGIDYWFEPINPQSPHPVRWKQWLLTTAVIAVLTMLVPLLLQPLFALLPFLQWFGVRHVFSAAIIVALVIYVVMPRLVPLLAKWLFR